MPPKKRGGWKRIVDNRMKGDWGSTDHKKKEIRINKKRAKKIPFEGHKRPVNKNATRYPEVLDTIVHEETHRKHPKMREKTVRKVTKRQMKTMSPKAKKKMYGLFR